MRDSTTSEVIATHSGKAWYKATNWYNSIQAVELTLAS